MFLVHHLRVDVEQIHNECRSHRLLRAGKSLLVIFYESFCTSNTSTASQWPLDGLLHFSKGWHNRTPCVKKCSSAQRLQLAIEQHLPGGPVDDAYFFVGISI
ncbi:MAG: hypothetical protein RIR69_1613 [Actinomycetota bacterium]